ncbi:MULTISPECIES: hypothetical protein [unclassified Rathayibacter]|uniref:hypothetical protein n=1 Tax=unclassified Rathayibacter TaxID=2609250 RepID=UPI0006FDA564|nr:MULTISPECIES: hypothetical protein [unclassified Rathayibacter]KQP97462.1 hypothetical protein ASF42_17360 [Rathayibacter sp. Leaf294]KQS07134.1 hypothetical protein ASG06_18095 [Rathayibacter sp. Leaf185]
MRRPAALLVAVALAVALSGCSQAQEPSPSADAAITGTPVPLSCEQLVPSSALTGLWAGFSPGDVDPTAVSAEIAGYDGVVCGWSDDAGATFQLAVAQLDPEIIEALKNEYYTTSKAVPTYGKPPAVEGYYEVASGRGVADAFVDQYWLEVSSESFVEPGDPEPLVRAALDALAG